MGKPLAMDLRKRALAAVDAGMSRRAAADRFGVLVSSVICGDAQWRTTGSFAPKPQGGDMRSRRIEARHGGVMATFGEARDQSLEELDAWIYLARLQPSRFIAGGGERRRGWRGSRDLLTSTSG